MQDGYSLQVANKLRINFFCVVAGASASSNKGSAAVRQRRPTYPMLEQRLKTGSIGSVPNLRSSCASSMVEMLPGSHVATAGDGHVARSCRHKDSVCKNLTMLDESHTDD